MHTVSGHGGCSHSSLPDIDACHLISNHDDRSFQLILRLSHPHITALELIYHGL